MGVYGCMWVWLKVSWCVLIIHLSSLLLSRVSCLRRSGPWSITIILSSLIVPFHQYYSWLSSKLADFILFVFTWAKAPGNTRARHRVATENIAIVNDMILLMRWYDIVDSGVKLFMIPLNFGTLHCLFPTAHIQIHILSQLRNIFTETPIWIWNNKNSNQNNVHHHHHLALDALKLICAASTFKWDIECVHWSCLLV